MTKKQNQRRYDLIVKETHTKLTSGEAAELAELQEIARKHADKVAPLPPLPGVIRGRYAKK